MQDYFHPQMTQQELLAMSSLALAHFALRIQPLLTPEEAAVYRRGRNAHPHGIPKHATPGEYARATGLEALFGALYLSGQTARIEALFAAMMEEDHAI